MYKRTYWLLQLCGNVDSNPNIHAMSWGGMADVSWKDNIEHYVRIHPHRYATPARKS